MIHRSEDGKIRILSLSYGKDSLACLGAIEELGLPLDGIVHAEVWFNDEIPADLPPMVEFKAKADAIIKERWGFDVRHVCATKKCSQSGNVERATHILKVFLRKAHSRKDLRSAAEQWNLRIPGSMRCVVLRTSQTISPHAS